VPPSCNYGPPTAPPPKCKPQNRHWWLLVAIHILNSDEHVVSDTLLLLGRPT